MNVSKLYATKQMQMSLGRSFRLRTKSVDSVAARERALTLQPVLHPLPKVEMRATCEALFVSQIFPPYCHATSLFYYFLMNNF